MSRPDLVTSLMVQQFFSGCNIFLTDMDVPSLRPHPPRGAGRFLKQVSIKKAAIQRRCAVSATRMTRKKKMADCFVGLRIPKQREIAAEAEKKIGKVLNYSATNSIRETQQEPGYRYRRGRHKKRRRSHLGRPG